MWYSVVELQTTDKREVFARLTTDADSPWFDGHFPGDPILPGIGQLGMVSDMIISLLGHDYYVSGLGRVKFRKRIIPGELLEIHAVVGKSSETYSFRITTGKDELVSSGVIRFAKIQNN